MKRISKNAINGMIGLGLSFPAAYFIFINVLDEFGYPSLLKGAWPFLQSLGIEESLGWNVNLLFLVGPVVAFLLNALNVLHIRSENLNERFDLQLSISKSWWNLVVAIFSCSILFFLASYGVMENCGCSKLFRLSGPLQDEMFRLTFRGVFTRMAIIETN